MTLSGRVGRLVRLRLDAALSQEDLAGRANLLPTFVGRLERGKRMPSLLVVEKLAGGLGLKMSELMSELEKVEGGIAGPATVD